MKVKKVETFYDGYPGDLLYDAAQELVNLSEEYKSLVKGTLLDKYEDKTADFQFPALTDAERKENYDRLDVLMDEFTKHPEHLKSRDKTPEEVVLMYITSGIMC